MKALKSIFFTILLMSFFRFAQAQTRKIDSINNLANQATTDTARINLLIQKTKLLSDVNLDSAILFSKKILAEAEKINYYHGEINARQELIKNYCFIGDYKSADENLKLLSKLIKLSKDSADYADLYYCYGLMYGMQARYDTAIQFLKKAAGICERLGDSISLIANYVELGIDYGQQSDFSRALIYQQKALQIAESRSDQRKQAVTLVNLAITYQQIGDTLRAEQTFQKSILIAKKNQIKDVELYAYNNLAGLYHSQQKWEEAYEFATKAAALSVEMGDQGIRAASLSKAAGALSAMKRFSEANQLAQKAVAVADSSGQPYNIFQAYSGMGRILYLQEKFKEAIPFYEKSFVAIKDAKEYTQTIGDCYRELSECYEKMGNTGSALADYKKYADISDSVRSHDNIRKATELTMKYEFDGQQRATQAEQEKVNATARTKQIALAVGLALMLLLAVVSFNGYRNKQKANILLQNQKKEIELTLEQLRATQSQLIQSEKMASLGELTAGIAHEIQNPINFVNNFSELNKELLLEMKEEMDNGNTVDAKEIANNVIHNEEKINHHGKRADAIVKGMLQHSQVAKGRKEFTDINALAEEYLRLSFLGLRARDKNFNATLQTHFDSGIGKINIVPQDIGRVLLNLFNNAFYSVHEKKEKFGGEYEPTLSVSTKKLRDKIEIRVKDNGMGIQQKVLDKIYQPFFTTKPTGQGTGLGLSLSYDIITKEHSGTLKVETSEGEGAEFVIQLAGN